MKKRKLKQNTILVMMDYYPVASPLSSITFGTTLRRWPIYRLHFALFTCSQNSLIPAINSDFVLGLTFALKCFLSLCHKFLIGFRSGDSGR